MAALLDMMVTDQTVIQPTELFGYTPDPFRKDGLF
jgi:hypothetical protein